MARLNKKLLVSLIGQRFDSPESLGRALRVNEDFYERFIRSKMRCSRADVDEELEKKIRQEELEAYESYMRTLKGAQYKKEYDEICTRAFKQACKNIVESSTFYLSVEDTPGQSQRMFVTVEYHRESYSSSSQGYFVITDAKDE